LLYNEYFDFHVVKAPGAWWCPINAIFTDDVEEGAEVYFCCTMSTLTFMWLKRSELGGVQLIPYLVTTLKKEQRYNFAVQ
jgi:hypothetical protein